MTAGAVVFINFLLTVASAVVGKAARDAIFLGRFTPVQMTAVDLVTIVAVTVVLVAQLRARARVAIRQMLIVAPLFFAAGDLLLWAGLRAPGPAWIAWVIYVWIGVQASLAGSYASVLAVQLLSFRDARRMCGRVGAGAIAGCIGGGLLARIVAQRTGAPELLLACGLLTAMTSGLLVFGWPMRETAFGEKDACAGGWRGLGINAAHVWESPHLHSLALLALISAAVTTIASLQFKSIARQTIADPDQLAALFGSFNCYAGMAALAVQLALTPRVLGRFGVGAALSIAPIALAAGSVGVLCTGTLAAAILMKGSDQVFRTSVDRTAIELLYRPLPPAELFDGRTFIDSVISRGGDAAGALLVLITVAVIHLPFSWLGVVTLPLVIGWLIVARAARRGYGALLLEGVRTRLPRGGAESGEPHMAIVDSSIRKRATAVRGVLDPDPDARLHALQQLAGSPRTHSKRTRRLLVTALAAEIVGLAILVDTAPTPQRSRVAFEAENLDTIERIARLLSLLSPATCPGYLASALRSGDALAEARAQAYLDTVLAHPHREMLMTLLDRHALLSAPLPSARAVVAPDTACSLNAVGGVRRVLALAANHFPKGAAS